MRRRKFIALLGGIAVATPWQRTARAQQPNEMRHIAVLASGNADVQVFKAGLAAFHERLRQLGWKDGQNVRIDLRPGKGDFDNIRKLASELAGLAPAVIVTVGGSAVGPLLQATRTVPIVFVFVPDPFGSGFVSSLSRPGGNATGFMAFEYSLSAKWFELLKQIARA
jgi:putative ABC transport system substrate-binding protein